jgi:hypothetical protein
MTALVGGLARMGVKAMESGEAGAWLGIRHRSSMKEKSVILRRARGCSGCSVKAMDSGERRLSALLMRTNAASVGRVSRVHARRESWARGLQHHVTI